METFRFCKGCFVGDKNRPDIKDKILVLYSSDYTMFEHQDALLTEHNLFDQKYQVNHNHFMYVFHLPIGYENNYYNVIDGKYSRLDDVYKRHILDFHRKYDNVSTMKGVLYKEERLYQMWEREIGQEIPRTQEIGTMPDMEYEMFDLDMVQKSKTTEWV